MEEIKFTRILLSLCIGLLLGSAGERWIGSRLAFVLSHSHSSHTRPTFSQPLSRQVASFLGIAASLGIQQAWRAELSRPNQLTVQRPPFSNLHRSRRAARQSRISRLAHPFLPPSLQRPRKPVPPVPSHHYD